MAFQLFNKNERAFGLDISASSLKIFQFEQKGGRTLVKSYNDQPLPKGLINSDIITDKVTFGHLLKQAMDKPQFGRLDTKYVVANLPESKSFVRVIQIPHMSDSEAENAVPFESESFIPLPIDQVYLDWQKLSQTSDKMNILIIASPKDFVDSYLDALEKSGLRPVALEVESQSCHRALVNAELKETLLIVDMSAILTSLIMVEEGNLQFTSTIPIAGNTFTESIARTLGVSSSKAEMIKHKVGIANTSEYPNIKTALLPVLNNLSSEIKNILKFHSEHSDKVVSKIIMAGGSSQLQNLLEFLTPQFSDMPGLAVELGNPLQNIKNLVGTPLQSTPLLNYTTAIGLALRGTNWNK
jgi:type IV pilus assembly protein PilM